jgi:hypothetical protein
MLEEVSIEEIKALRLTMQQFREWEQSWRDDMAEIGRTIGCQEHQADFKRALIMRRRKGSVGPLKHRIKATCDSIGIMTFAYADPPKSRRKIHGIASITRVDKHEQSLSLERLPSVFPYSIALRPQQIRPPRRMGHDGSEEPGTNLHPGVD